MNILLVIDMQKDFIDGSLGTPEACNIVPNVITKIKEFKGEVIFTRDAHTKEYLNTKEGKKLPVEHCIIGTEGFELNDGIKELADNRIIIDKPTFGSIELGHLLYDMNKKEAIQSVTLIGLCTDICVISNALIIKSMLPEINIIVDASCCAGVTRESHNNALKALEMCHIEII